LSIQLSLLSSYPSNGTRTSPEHERYWLLFISRCLNCPFVNKTEVYILIFWLLVF
jgi:hypothetical protein